jgi:hypothetical protein
MGIFKKDEMMLDFKGVQTDDMSSTVPYMNKLNYDAKMLVNQLGPYANTNRKGLVLFNESEQYDLYKLFEKSTTLDNNDNNFSETSPFISSDVYNQLLNKIKSKNQSGGGKKNVSKASKAREEDRDDDFENESSTTSSEESESDKKNKKFKKLFKQKSDEVDLEEEEEEEEFSEMSAGSYVSSSAHTDGSESSNETDSNSNFQSEYDNKSKSHKSNKSYSITSSTVSVRNHRNRHHNMSDSVNTSDVNIISLDE